MPRKRPKAASLTGKNFRPYALAIGQMNLVWNDLHESLGALFANSFAPDRAMQGGAIWGAVTSDRQKRLLLDAAINWIGKETHSKFPKLASDVLWITKRANSLEDKRNNVIHSPLSEVTSYFSAAFTERNIGDVYPSGMWNERAQKLAKALGNKSLLGEISVYRDYAFKLSSFSQDVFVAWVKPSETWPERPKLPPLKDGG